MVQRHSENIGSYIPSFFEMHVDTNDDNMNINHLSLRDKTVLFHEYIHFLQDFMTGYGLFGIYVNSEYIRSVVNRIYSLKQCEFHVPISIEDNRDMVKVNKQLHGLVFGDTVGPDYLFIRDIIIDDDSVVDNPYLPTIQSAYLELASGDYLCFGAGAIMESMADLLESHCSPRGYIQSPEYPYKAAIKVADYYDLDFARDELRVLALCDCCLMTTHPGLRFVEIMMQIKDGKISFPTPESIYDYFYQQTYEYADGRGRGKLLQIYLENLNKIGELLKSYIKDTPVANSYYEWIDRLVNFAADIRKNDPYFMIRMAEETDLDRNGHWGYCICQVGTPLMGNNHAGHYFKIVPQKKKHDGEDVEFLKAIGEIKKVFDGNSHACSMYEWCQKSPMATPNRLCLTAPWRKCEESYLCPFAYLWKHWHLTGIYPIITDDE